MLKCMIHEYGRRVYGKRFNIRSMTVLGEHKWIGYTGKASA